MSEPTPMPDLHLTNGAIARGDTMTALPDRLDRTDLDQLVMRARLLSAHITTRFALQLRHAIFGWTPVSELPNEDQTVLGWDGTTYRIVYWCDGWKLHHAGAPATVTHWRPLPEGPAREESP